MITIELEQGYWVEETRSPQVAIIFEMPDEMSVSTVAELLEGARRAEWVDDSNTRNIAEYNGIKQINRGQGRMLIILDKEATA